MRPQLLIHVQVGSFVEQILVILTELGPKRIRVAFSAHRPLPIGHLQFIREKLLGALDHRFEQAFVV